MPVGPPLGPDWLKGRTLIATGIEPKPPKPVMNKEQREKRLAEIRAERRAFYESLPPGMTVSLSDIRKDHPDLFEPEPAKAEPDARPARKFLILMAAFGWVWIAASLATVIFAGLALAAGWSWWNAGYTLIAAVVAKWLATGFRENYRRVLFEQELIAGGVSEEEARAAWLEAYQRQ